MTRDRWHPRTTLPALLFAAAGAAQTAAPPVPADRAANAAVIALPTPVRATALQRELASTPSTIAVVDLRPAWQFAEWHLPGAVNVALAQIGSHIAALPADRRVVLVDRDGTTAFAVAGALLARDPRRPLHALAGGLQEYWRATAFGVASPAAAAPLSPSPTASKPAKKRGAGC